MRYRTLTLLSLAAITFLTLTGCGDESCMPYYGPGVKLTVLDSSGEPALCDATVHVHNNEGELIEYREFTDGSCNYYSASSPIRLLEERSGTFQITVSKDGYEDDVLDVVVEIDSYGCNVIPVDTTSQLGPYQDGE